jgi:ATP-dependent helicase/nuclease subunit A
VFSRTEPRGSSSISWWQRLVNSGAIDPQQMLWQPQAPATPVSTGSEAPTLPVLPTLTIPRATPDPASNAQDSIEQLLGQVVHRVLEWMTALDTTQRDRDRLQKAVQAAAREMQLPGEALASALELATRILSAPGLQPWLDPRAVAWAGNEVALQHQGQLLRIDRLVAQDTAEGRHWWVLDYKLAHRPQELVVYRQQLARYVDAVSALQPQDRVGAAFITSAGEWVELSVK